jgi:anti-sigma regulatory factor (Ser/Thr protein kinase)
VPRDPEILTRSGGRSLALAAAPDSVTTAREFTRRAMSSWQVADLTDDVLLAVTELVTNAVLHGIEPIMLLLEPCGHGVRVEVSDRSPQMPNTTPTSWSATSGRGLAIVSAISRDWGAHRLDSGGKAVWAEFVAHEGRANRVV